MVTSKKNIGVGFWITFVVRIPNASSNELTTEGIEKRPLSFTYS